MYKVGQIVQNKTSKLKRVITKVVKDKVYWVSKDGLKKGSCSKNNMNRWVAGKD